MDQNHNPDPDRNDEPDAEPGSGNLRQIVAVAVLLVALIGGGLWLTGALRGTAAIQDCVAAGRTNCAPIKP